MPSRTPIEAFESFIKPIQEDLSCLGVGKITTSSNGRALGGMHAWSINRENGLVLTNGFHFEAMMNYEIVRQDNEYRVTTRAYLYSLRAASVELFAIHWHPAWNSVYEYPHIHVNLSGVDFDSSKSHLPIGRVTFEDAVQWVIEITRQPAREDWKEILDKNRAEHVRRRTWHDRPNLA